MIPVLTRATRGRETVSALVLLALSGCGCDEPQWAIYSGGEGRGEYACRGWPAKHPAEARNCFPCRTTDFYDARRLCDGSGVKKP